MELASKPIVRLYNNCTRATKLGPPWHPDLDKKYEYNTHFESVYHALNRERVKWYANN